MSWNDQPGSNGPRNPWGGSGGNGPRNPWGNGGHGNGGGGPNPPDIDELLRRAREDFSRFIPGGFGPGKALFAVVVLLVGFWLASGFYLVQPNENAVVLTFGKYERTDEMPGLKYRWPWPIQTVDIVNVTQEQRIEVGFRGGRSNAGVQDVADESLMLTGDENIIDIDFVVLWRVGNARHHLYEIRDPEDTIKKVAESAMREVIGRSQIQSALTEGRGQIQTDTRNLMQKMLDDYKAGVVVNNVQLQKVDPPGQVIDAFNDVQRARADRERLRNEAEAYRNDIIPRARGQAEQLRQEAQAYRDQAINRAQGDAKRFAAIYDEYKNAKDITETRLYLETLEKVIGNSKTLVIDSGKNGANVVPWLPLSDLPRASSSSPLSVVPQPSQSQPVDPVQ